MSRKDAPRQFATDIGFHETATLLYAVFADISRPCGVFGKSSAKSETTHGTRPLVRRSGNGMWKDHRLYLSQRTSKKSSSRTHGNVKMLYIMYRYV